MPSTWLGTGCPPDADPFSCLQVVRRRTQRRKSGITSLLFGEYYAVGRWAQLSGSFLPAKSKPLEPGVGGSEERGQGVIPSSSYSGMDSESPCSWEGVWAGAMATIALWASQGRMTWRRSRPRTSSRQNCWLTFERPSCAWHAISSALTPKTVMW